MYLAPACTFWLALGSAWLELPAILASGSLGVVAAAPYKFLAAAAMGFTVNSLAYIVIQTASSLTLKVLGTVKNAVVVWAGIVFLQEKVTGLQVRLRAGGALACVCCGSGSRAARCLGAGLNWTNEAASSHFGCRASGTASPSWPSSGTSKSKLRSRARPRRRRRGRRGQKTPPRTPRPSPSPAAACAAASPARSSTSQLSTILPRGHPRSRSDRLAQLPACLYLYFSPADGSFCLAT